MYNIDCEGVLYRCQITYDAQNIPRRRVGRKGVCVNFRKHSHHGFLSCALFNNYLIGENESINNQLSHITIPLPKTRTIIYYRSKDVNIYICVYYRNNYLHTSVSERRRR